MTVQMYLKLFSLTNETDLNNELTKVSSSDKKQSMKTMIQFLQKQGDDAVNDFIQFYQEQSFRN